ncbi:MAG: hypothetical protein J6C39_04725 [Clostridia bacterium]|nr:hypothetical protein [Clostridia bacterium]MBO5205992.1 hypothetical protein [Clostridia bacterium]
MVENKSLYIVVSQTGTILSRIVKWVTKDKYNHVSVGTKEDLSDLYSFGRTNPYNPFHGGFVKESPTSGTFGRFYKTKAVVIELPLPVDVYDAIVERLHEMYLTRELYHYNYKGLFLAYVGKTREKKNCFYCSEFVQKLLSDYGYGMKKDEGELVCPNDFVNVPGGRLIYKGLLRSYNAAREAGAVKTQ